MPIAIPQIITEDRASGAQDVEGSLRFDTTYKTYLTRTPASSGNQKTWTWSCWIKRQTPGNGADQYFFQGRANASYYTYFLFDTNDKIRLYASRGGASAFDLITTARFRDAGSWYHIVIAMDNTQGTASDRMKIYVNGVEETDFATDTYPSQNVDYYLNDNYPMQVSGIDGATVTQGNYSQMYLIDGQMLDASYFGYTDELTNTWRPKKFNIDDAPTADWGTCGSYLPFDGSAPIGEDQSGKGNHWTPKNFGGSAKISKATGALPILETMSAGNVALGNRARGNAGIAVTVAAKTGGGNAFYFDGVEAPTLNFARGQTVTFDTSDSTVATHPLRFSITSNNSGGSEYTDGRVTGASEGSAGAATTITFPTSAPDTLYYYCTAHSGMGGALGLRSDVQVADPYAWKNTLALAGSAKTDVCPSVNCTTSEKALTFNGSMTGTVNAGLATDHYNFYGKSFYFDGSGDYITVASSADCSNMGTGDFTFEAWVNLANTSNRGCWFDTRASGGTTGLTFGHETDGSVRVYMNASGGGDITVVQSTPCIVNTWYHMAVTRESGTVRLFINGRVVSSGTRTSDLNNTNVINIGYRTYTSSSYDYFTGWMNDARIYKGFAKYTSNFIPASTNPDIQLNSPSGIDYESHLAKTTNGSVGFKGVAPSGSGNELNWADYSDFDMGTGDWTQEMWVYPLRQGNGERQNLIGNKTSWGANYFITQVSHPSYPGKAMVWWYNENDSAPVSVTQREIPERVWTHLAFVRNGNNIKIFVNGKDDTTVITSSPSGSIDMSLSGMHFGHHGSSGTYYNGFVSNLRIVKGTAVYTENFIPSKEPLTNVSGTVLLCCQDQTSSTNYAVSPQPYGTITTGGDPTASSTAPTGSSGSVDFDGNDKLTLASNSDFAFGEGPYTVEFWMYSDTVDQSCVIYNVGTTNGFVINRGSTIGINQYNVGNKVHTSDITDQAWVHYAFVREGTGTNGTKIYKDGTLDTTGTDATNWTTTHESAIGGNVANSQYFDGKISNFRIVKGTAVYTSNFTAPTRDLTAIDGTVLLCCQSATDETAAADIPSAITQTNDTKSFTFNPFDRNDDFVEGSESDYCILNYLDISSGSGESLVHGLKFTNTGASNVSGTIPMPSNSGKFYWEMQVDKDGGGVLGIGALPVSQINNLSDMNKIFGYSPNGSKYENSTQTSYGEAYRNGDFISVLFDTDLKKLEFWKNGVSQGLAFQGSDDNTGGVFLDGSNDYLSVASSADLVMRGNFTMECWFYPKDTSGVQVILNGRGTASSGGPVIYINGTDLVFDHGGGSVVTASSAVSAGTWYHVAGTREGTTWTLYKNGASVGSATNTTSYSSNTAFAIGNSHASEYFCGMVSNVRVVARCVYTSAFDVPTKELENIPNTKLLCCQNRDNALVSVGTQTGQTLTVGGSPTPSSTAPTGSSGSVDFDGSDDVLYVGGTAPSELVNWFSTAYTIEYWINADAFGGSSNSKSNVVGNSILTSSSEWWSFGPKGDGEVMFYYWKGSQTDFVSGTTLNTGTWYHLAFVHDGSNNLAIYVDGDEKATATISGTPQVSSADDQNNSDGVFGIGRVANGNWFNGKISNLRVSKRAVYTSNFTPPSRDLGADVLTSLLCCQDPSDDTTSAVVPPYITATSAPSPRDCNPFDDKLAMNTNLYFPQVHCNALDVQFNFGQNPYRYTPPDGYKSVCLSNISDPEIVRSDQYVGIATWSGAQSGSGQALRRIPLDFQPDFVWIKQLNQAYTTGHQLYDSVRGAGNENELDSSSDQYMGEGNPNEYGYIQKFDGVGGFTVKGGTTDYDYVDKSSVNYVAWCWKAGGNKNTFNVDGVGYASFAASPLTAGPTAGDGIGQQTNMTVTGCSVGTKQGFSIIRYNTANFSGSGNFPHGLDKAPQILITKQIVDISGAANWGFYYNMKGGYGGSNVDQNTEWVTLNENIATGGNGTGRWVGGEDGPFAYLGRDHIWVDQGSYANANMEVSKSSIAYMWHSVPGLQKFGTYEGNGNANGPYINCGFRPALVIVRRLDTANNWQITDDTRSPFNVMNKGLYADLDNEQQTTDRVDYLSNGFKIRATLNENNANGGTYLYMAWARTPYNNMYGGQSNAR